ncbi:hypothetical protein [Streptomyces nanshensis]|uniref:hypothetical protein n=1 Tax=Streptomyces nanshensis TaxID=518642 RepID=UPI00114CE39B|nr:hypothetical protein [Streptomyces nanshensis]
MRRAATGREPRQWLRLLALGHCVYGLLVAYLSAPSAWTPREIVALHTVMSAGAACSAAGAVGFLGGPRRRGWCAGAGVLALAALARCWLAPDVAILRWMAGALASLTICLTLDGLLRRPTDGGAHLRTSVRLLGIADFGLCIAAFIPRPSLHLGLGFFLLCILVLGAGDEWAKRNFQKDRSNASEVPGGEAGEGHRPTP